MSAHWSLSARLIGAGLASTLVVALLSGWLLRGQLHDVVLRGVGHELQDRIERLVAASGAISEPQTLVGSDGNPPEFLRIYSGWYWTLKGKTTEVQSRSLWDGTLEDVTPLDAPRHALWHRARGPMAEPLIGLQHVLRIGGEDYILSVFAPASESDDEMERIDHVLLTALGGLVLVFTSLMLLQVRVGLAPLRRLQSDLWRVRHGHQTSLGNAYGPDLDPVAAEITEVLERNALLVDRSRHHTSNLGHALKKPLAVLNLASRNPVVPAEEVRAQVDVMHRLIDRHLILAASGAGDARWIEVTPRLEQVLALVQQLHSQRNLHWSLTTSPDLRWRGEATDLDEMVGNLMDNAGKWATHRVHVLARQDMDGWCLEIEDDGPGLTDTQREQAMQRGKRFDEAVEGTGLGLAIVRDIAQTYGGSLRLDSSRLGGLRCVLHLR